MKNSWDTQNQWWDSTQELGLVDAAAADAALVHAFTAPHVGRGSTAAPGAYAARQPRTRRRLHARVEPRGRGRVRREARRRAPGRDLSSRGRRGRRAQGRRRGYRALPPPRGRRRPRPADSRAPHSTSTPSRMPLNGARGPRAPRVSFPEQQYAR